MNASTVNWKQFIGEVKTDSRLFSNELFDLDGGDHYGSWSRNAMAPNKARLVVKRKSYVQSRHGEF